MTLLVGAAVAMLVVCLLAPVGHATPRSLLPYAGRPRADRRPRRGAPLRRQIDRAYPDALDLFMVAVQAGDLPVPALQRIRPHVHPAIAAGIDDVVRRTHQGQRSADALVALVDAVGTRALSLVATLTTAERTGLAIGPMVDRIADDARQHRRRQAEADARELPVRLAVPLVLCTLPSFVLVAIAPLLIGALSSLRAA